MSSKGQLPVSPAPPSGLILAMDTSGREGSIAVGTLGRQAIGGSQPLPEILRKGTLEAEGEHAALLVPRIRQLLDDLGVGPDALGGIVVGAGPGSFTGVRVSAATAKGMARALHVPLWAFSSLAAAAAGLEGESLHPRMILFDARGDRVYAAAYRFIHGAVETVLAPAAVTIPHVLEELIPPGAILGGSGALRHRDLLEGAGVSVLPPPAGLPSADGLLRIFALDAMAPPLPDPGRWEPDYLRESGAERFRKTRKEK